MANKFFKKIFTESNDIRNKLMYPKHVHQPHHHTLLCKSKLVEQVVQKIFSTITSCKYSKEHVHKLCVDKICYDKIDLDNMSQLEYLTYQNKLVHDILFMICM